MVLPGPDVLEPAGLKAWPGIEVDYDGKWVRRATLGYTQRANSVQSLDPDDDNNAPARLEASREWFASRGLPAIFRVTPLAGPQTVAALDAAEWRVNDPSHVFAMELGSVGPDPRGKIYGALDRQFLDAQIALQTLSEERLAKMCALLGVLHVPAAGIVLYGDSGEPLASALMSIADSIVVTGLVITDSTRRRQGLGAAMMRTGLAWAKRRGASIAALNVAADNSAGQALYRSLGYRHQYDYHYRVMDAA